jgi:hypothetical protein
MFVVVELSYGTRGGGKGKKNDSANNINMHYISVGRGHNDVY